MSDLSAQLDDLIDRVNDSFPAVSSGESDPMIDGVSALYELQDFAQGIIDQLAAVQEERSLLWDALRKKEPAEPALKLVSDE